MEHLTLRKKKIKAVRLSLLKQYQKGQTICQIIKHWSGFVESLVYEICQDYLNSNNFCVLALGGFGRFELFPYSDLDLLILHQEHIAPKELEQGAKTIRYLWDLGFHVGHQMATLDDCLSLASQNLTVISALSSKRLLFGNHLLYQSLCYGTHPSQMWSAPQFLKAKWVEQKKRHQKFNTSAYQLEPNIKQSPGGLRDLQTLLILTQRYFGDTTIHHCLERGFLTGIEYQALLNSQHFLWEVRFVLHMTARRAEERLLFDYQKELALILGYDDDKNELGIEKFMKQYFTVIKTLRELNELLIQVFRDLLFAPSPPKIKQLNAHFITVNRYIEVTDKKVFQRSPEALLDIFLLMAKHPDIKGIRANTIRLLRKDKFLINHHFRHKKSVCDKFMTLLNIAPNSYILLKRLHHYGLLAQYIPPFNHIVGRMQYDLFHTYTVDQHTLFVIRNILLFKDQKKKFALYHQIFRDIEKPSLLYIAALFHDIGKGQGGNHSLKGAELVKEFCLRHELSKQESMLIIWLVKHHLLMSHTAQRKDIYNTETLITFCKLVGNQQYLDNLYLLTVADICATNPSLWNSWRDALLQELYRKARDYLSHQVDIDEPLLVIKNQEIALTHIQGLDRKAILQLWQTFKSSYFIHESANIIAQHTKAILQANVTPVIQLFNNRQAGGSQLLIYMPNIPTRFFITCTILTNLGLNVVEARILTGNHGYGLDIYLLLDEHHKPLSSTRRIEKLKQTLSNYLTSPITIPSLIKRHLNRRQKHFAHPPFISFEQKETTILFLIAPDKPGTLAKIAKVFSELNIQLHHAKIATAGERIEDTFYITNQGLKPLSSKQCLALQKQLMHQLNKVNQ